MLELPDAALTPQIQTTMPRVMDAFQTTCVSCARPISTAPPVFID